jgi:hypothetical protein
MEPPAYHPCIKYDFHMKHMLATLERSTVLIDIKVWVFKMKQPEQISDSQLLPSRYGIISVDTAYQFIHLSSQVQSTP